MAAATQTGPASLRMPLMAAGILVVSTIVVVAGVRWSGVSISEPDAPVRMTRSLQFVDRPDGGIDVIDASAHRRIDTVTGEAGFIRGTLRGLARERRRSGVGPEVPFELVSHVDGRLTLLDAATNRRVDLESFGPTNLAEFARLLHDGAPATAQRN